MFSIVGPVLWSACVLVAVVAAVLAGGSPRAMVAGRISVGVLMLLGGAAFNAVQLAAGNDYTGFADPAHFRWVTDTWEAVVPPNHVVLVGALVVFEATVGVLILSGGRRTRLGYLGGIAFHAALWLFGWFETVYVLLVLPALVLLLRAERRAAAVPAHPQDKPPSLAASQRLTRTGQEPRRWAHPRGDQPQPAGLGADAEQRLRPGQGEQLGIGRPGGRPMRTRGAR